MTKKTLYRKRDFKGDKAFKKLSPAEKKELLGLLNERKPTPTCVGDNIWIGEIRHCPICEATRITSCCACGCGNCETCGYRWTCVPVQTEIGIPFTGTLIVHDGKSGLFFELPEIEEIS